MKAKFHVLNITSSPREWWFSCTKNYLCRAPGKVTFHVLVIYLTAFPYIMRSLPRDYAKLASSANVIVWTSWQGHGCYPVSRVTHPPAGSAHRWQGHHPSSRVTTPLAGSRLTIILTLIISFDISLIQLLFKQRTFNLSSFNLCKYFLSFLLLFKQRAKSN